MAQLKSLLVDGKSRFIDKIYANEQIISKVVQGTSPFTVDSSTLVSNLNADLVDGQHFSYTNTNNTPTYLWGTSSDGTNYLVSRTSMHSGIADKVMTVTNTTDSLHYLTFVDSNNTPNAAEETLYTSNKIVFNPGTGYLGVGTASPSQKLHVTGTIYSSAAQGTEPLKVDSTTLVAKLNADLLDGAHTSDIRAIHKAGTHLIYSTDPYLQDASLTGAATPTFFNGYIIDASTVNVPGAPTKKIVRYGDVAAYSNKTFTSPKVQIRGGRMIRFDCWMMRESGVTGTNRTFTFKVNHYNAAGTITTVTVNSRVTVPQGAWTRYTYCLRSPATACEVSASFEFSYNNTGIPMYFGGLHIYYDDIDSYYLISQDASGNNGGRYAGPIVYKHARAYSNNVAGYKKFATWTTATLTSERACKLVLLVSGGYSLDRAEGILTVNVRWAAGSTAASTPTTMTAVWTLIGSNGAATPDINPSNFILTWKINTTGDEGSEVYTATMSLYCYRAKNYTAYAFNKLEEQSGYGAPVNYWVFYDSNGSYNSVTAIPAAETQVISVIGAIQNKASSAGVADTALALRIPNTMSLGNGSDIAGPFIYKHGRGYGGNVIGYKKIASWTTASLTAEANSTLVLLVTGSNRYTDTYKSQGILTLNVNWAANSTAASTPTIMDARWSLASSDVNPSLFILTWKINTTGDEGSEVYTATMTLYYYLSAKAYRSHSFQKLDEFGQNGYPSNNWTLYDATGSTNNVTSIPAAETQVVSVLGGIKNNAATATEATHAANASNADNADKLDNEHAREIRSVPHRMTAEIFSTDPIFNDASLTDSSLWQGTVTKNPSTAVASGTPYAPGPMVLKCGIRVTSPAVISGYIPVQPGRTIKVDTWLMRLSGASGTNRTWYVGVQQFDRNKNAIAANTGRLYLMNGIAGPAKDSKWVKYSYNYTVPLTGTPYPTPDPEADPPVESVYKGDGVCYLRFFIMPNYSNTSPTVTYFGGIHAYYTDIYNTATSSDSATTATSADTVKTVTRSTNAAHYLSFVDSDNANPTSENVYTSSKIVFNPSTGSLGLNVASPTHPLDASGGVITVTANGNTLSIGSQNASWTHFSNSANRPFYFSHSASFNGSVLPYTDNSATLGDSSHRWSMIYGMQATLKAAQGTAPLVVDSSTQVANLKSNFAQYADVLRDPVYYRYVSGNLTAGRRASGNVNWADGGLHYFLATSSMTTGKPAGDGHILHMAWDNGKYEGQLTVPTSDTGVVQWRTQANSDSWGMWHTILDSSNSSVSGDSTSITVKINGTTKSLTIPTVPSVTGISELTLSTTAANYLTVGSTNYKIKLPDTIPWTVSTTDDKVSQSETTTASYRGIVLGYNSNAAANTGITTSVINKVYVTNNLTVQPSTGNIVTKGQYISKIANGTAPIVVDSSTVATNLNADYLDGLHGADFVEKRYGRFYPFIASDPARSIWHKVTFPHTGYTSSSNAWFMLTMEIVLSGSYQNAAAGKIFLNYYFTKNTSNVWSVGVVKGIAIGTYITSSGVQIKYDIANPAIFYIKVSPQNYTSFAIENLSANDTAQNYDYRTTTIEAIEEGNIPAAANKIVPIATIETNDGSTLIASNLAASKIKTAASTATGNYYLTFVDSNNSTEADESLYTSAKLYVQPSTGNIVTSGYVAVGTGGTDSYVGSNTTSNIYLHNSSGNVLVAEGKTIRRGTSLADVSLGDATYPWAGVYANQFISKIAQGTAPIVVDSSTVATNLNADYLDGEHEYNLRSRPKDEDILYTTLPMLEKDIVLKSGLSVVATPGDGPYKKCWLSTSYITYYTDYLWVRPGDRYRLETWIMKPSDATGTNGTLYIGVERYDINDKAISSNSGCSYLSGMSNATIPADGVWYRKTGTFTIPETHTVYSGSTGKGVYRIRIRCLINYSAGTSPLYWAGFRVYKRWDLEDMDGILPISMGGTDASTAAGARANLGTWALVNDTYPTLMPADGTTNNWVKVGTSNNGFGIIPSTSGEAGSGHNYIGTSTWYWKYAYIDEIHGTLKGKADAAAYADAIRDPVYHTSSSRRNSANINFADGGLHYYLATSTMTVANGKPANDGHILHMSWDNGSYEGQLTLPTSTSKSMQWRSQNGGTWSSWITILDSSNYTSYLSDTKVTQTITASSNTSWRPLLLGYSYSDAATFAPTTVTNTTYATHLAKFKPSTGQLAINGLYKMNTNGTVATGSNDEIWNTNGTTVKISTLFTTEPEYLSMEVKNATSPSTPITEYVGVTITNKFTNEIIYEGIVYQNTRLDTATNTYTTNPIEIPPGIEYVISCSPLSGFKSPDDGIFLSIPGYSRTVQLNFIPIRVDILSIDFSKGSAPSAFLTYTPASGTSVIQWIRNNSHRYAAYFAKLTNNVTDGDGKILSPRGAQMYICQLKDNDSTKFANNNSYSYPTDTSVENGDIYMRLPKFYYRISGDSSAWTVEFADSDPGQGFQMWDPNNLIGVYPVSIENNVPMNEHTSTTMDFYMSSPRYTSTSMSTNDICLNKSSCLLSAATVRNNISGYDVDRFFGGVDSNSIKELYPDVDVKFLRYKWVQMLRLLFLAYYNTTNCTSVCGTGTNTSYCAATKGLQGRGMTDTTSSTGNNNPTNFWGVEDLWGTGTGRIYTDLVWEYYNVSGNANNINKLGLLADMVQNPDLATSEVVYTFGTVPSDTDTYYGRTISKFIGTPSTPQQKLVYSPIAFSYRWKQYGNTVASSTTYWYSGISGYYSFTTGDYKGIGYCGAGSIFQDAINSSASGFTRICYYGPVQEVYSPTVFYDSIKPKSAVYRRLRGNGAIPSG